MAISLLNYNNTLPHANCGQCSLMRENLFDITIYSFMLLRAGFVSVVALVNIKLSVVIEFSVAQFKQHI
jgi:hypothetical protein